MAYCPKCGRELSQDNLFCGSCGAQAQDSASLDDLAIFVGKNSEKYLRHFAKFRRDGADRFAATWNWPAFIVPVYWMLYRKLYLWALLLFVIGFIPIVNILTHLAFGVGGNFIYYRHATKKLRKIDEAGAYANGEQRTAAIARAGGVNRGVIIVLIAITIIAILAAMTIPMFSNYRHRIMKHKPALTADAGSAYAETAETRAPRRIDMI